MDCMRLFTKEDVLDGDEKPVSHPTGPGSGGFSGKAPPWQLQPGSPRRPRQLCPPFLSDLLSLPRQETVCEEVLHPEVPQGLGAAYP